MLLLIFFRTYFSCRCNRLGLISLSYLWRRDQDELLNEMIQSSVNAILIKVAALGLEIKHLGKSICEMQPHLVKIVSQVVSYLIKYNIMSIFVNIFFIIVSIMYRIASNY